MDTRIKHHLGKNAEEGHKYIGGCFSVRAENGAWWQWAYGDPVRNNPDTEQQALHKAKEWCKANPL